MGGAGVPFSVQASAVPAYDLAVGALRGLEKHLAAEPAPTAIVYVGPHPLVIADGTDAAHLTGALGFDVPVFSLYPSSSSGSQALHLAARLAAGDPQARILVLGVSRFTQMFTHEEGQSVAASFLEKHFVSLPEHGLYDSWLTPFALAIQAYLNETDAPHDLIAAIRRKNRTAGEGNSLCGMKVTDAANRQATSIVGMLTPLDVAPLSDGAIALLVGGSEAPGKVALAGMAHEIAYPRSGWNAPGQAPFAVNRRAFERAQSQLAQPVTPTVWEIDDRVAPLEAIAAEDLGILERSAYAEALTSDRLQDPATCMINGSGGHLSLGMGGGAHGLAKALFLYETISQGKAAAGLLHEADGFGASAAVTHFMEADRGA